MTANGWATAATIDLIYDVLHMMGRDDIPVGLGSVSPLDKPYYSCDYVKFVPQGRGGHLDADTLFGLARDLPRSPRRFSFVQGIDYLMNVIVYQVVDLIFQIHGREFGQIRGSEGHG